MNEISFSLDLLQLKLKNSKTEIFNNNITNETIKQDAKFLKVKNKRNGIS